MLDPISLISGAISLGEKWLTGESQDDRLEKELQSQTVREVAKTRRALIKRSTSRLRFFTLIILTAPFIAPIFPWVSVADVQAYFNNAIEAVPQWWVASLQAAFAAIWAGAEVRNLNAGRDERRLAEREAERETEYVKSLNRDSQPEHLP